MTVYRRAETLAERSIVIACIGVLISVCMFLQLLGLRVDRVVDCTDTSAGPRCGVSDVV